MQNEKITCYECPNCKIWYDEESYTMRLSCTQTSEHGKTITWASYPTYTRENGIFVKTKDTIESITEKFTDYAKRRLAPSWCKLRNKTK